MRCRKQAWKGLIYDDLNQDYNIKKVKLIMFCRTFQKNKNLPNDEKSLDHYNLLKVHLCYCNVEKY